jgi:hypothetical protein
MKGKKLFSASIIGLAFMLCACTVMKDSGAGSSVENLSLPKKGCLEIVIDNPVESSLSSTRAIVSIETNFVTKAIFSLIDPNGILQTQEWEKGSSCVLNFDVLTLGIHNLLIEEIDSAANHFYTSNSINIEAFATYTVHVTLGGNLVVVIDKPPLIPPFTNINITISITSNYFTNAVKSGIIRVYSEDGKYFIEEINGVISKNSISYRILNGEIIPDYFDGTNVVVDCTGWSYFPFYNGEIYINHILSNY